MEEASNGAIIDAIQLGVRLAGEAAFMRHAADSGVLDGSAAGRRTRKSLLAFAEYADEQSRVIIALTAPCYSGCGSLPMQPCVDLEGKPQASVCEARIARARRAGTLPDLDAQILNAREIEVLSHRRKAGTW